MSRLKTFLIYVLCIIGFWILSDLLINVGINSTYKPIERIDNNSEIEVYQAEATLINGRIFGVIHNPEHRYIKMQLFSERNKEIGTRYIEINEPTQDGISPLEIHFKINNVKYYSLEMVAEKGEDTGSTIDLIPGDISGAELFWGVLIVLMIW